MSPDDIHPPRIGLTAQAEDADALRERIRRLQRINKVLIDRLDRQDEARGSAYATFQAAMALEREIKTRNRELEAALSDLSVRNAELAQARAAAVEASRAKNRFLRAASHDLLQPLSAAKLFLASLGDTSLDESQYDLVGRLGSAFGLVEELMHAVLDIARLDSQRIEFSRKPVRLAVLFDRLNAEFQHVAQARGLTLRFASTSAMVDSDPTFLFRIAQNLLSNALKYTETGGVLVGARPRGTRVWLEVRDTGIGIAAEDRNRIFDEFQRINPDQSAPGMGLGLSIVRGACLRLGHPISLLSEPGRGSMFRVVLPRISKEQAATLTGDDAPGCRQADLRGRRVIVVENDTAMACAYQRVLGADGGMSVTQAISTAEAVAALADDQPAPEAVLADYHLESGDTGLEAIRAIRENTGLPVPAIVITANRDPDMQRACRDYGVRILDKPVSPETLRAALLTLLTVAT